MALWVCRGCTTKYSVGAPACPHCGSPEYREEGSDMAKITVHGGPTGGDESGAQVTGAAWSSNDEPDQWPNTGDAEAPEVVEEASDEPREFVEVPLGETAELVSEDGEEVPLLVSDGDTIEEGGAPEALTVTQLRDALAERGLPTSGLKAELIKRLRAADEETSDG